MTQRIAMWSGPRNLSTAMMRAFENRSDCAVWDEPFYAAYLVRTGLKHPMHQEVIQAGETDPDRVAAFCANYQETPLQYQKHMTQHMAPEWLGDWITSCQHAFLIRSPERVLASYVQKRQEVSEADIGFIRQKEIYDQITQETGKAPPVLEAEDVRRAPRDTLIKLCAALDISFDPAMLNWPKGKRGSDGVWAPVWYGAVENSTGFTPPPENPPAALPKQLQDIADLARPAFEALQKTKL